MNKKWDHLTNRPRTKPKKTWEEKTARAPRPKVAWEQRFSGVPERPKVTTEEIILERQKWDSTTRQTFGVVKFDQ